MVDNNFKNCSNNGRWRRLIPQWLSKAWIIPSVLSFVMAIGFAYAILLPNVDEILGRYEFVKSGGGYCDVFQGRWMEEERQMYPLYNATECPFAERGFSCWENGRKDKDYAKWRWKPEGCEIPRFDATRMLEQLRGKRVVFVGDSQSRTQWESWICMLMTGVADKTSVYEVNGSHITKTIRYLGVRFRDHNITVDFYRSVFLMKKGYQLPPGAPNNVRMTVRLDFVDDISALWLDSDVLVFNSGGWWTHNRLFNEMRCFFQIGDSLEFGMSVIDGYKRALNTWADWAEANINPNRTAVFFRTIESTHWRGPNQCDVSEKPLVETKGRDKNEKSDIIMEVLKKKMKKVPVTVMHLTPMGSYRSDAHVGNWGDNPAIQDCGHWCLPGLPDMWNEILFSYLLPKRSSSPH